MGRLYSDENFPLPVVEELRRLGHDVVTIQDEGRASESVPDDEVLELAARDNRAILTLNRRDFIRLHSQRSTHAGIIVCTVDPDFVGQAGRIHAIIELHMDLSGQLIRVNRPARHNS